MRSRRRASHTSTAPRRCTRVSTHTHTFTRRHAHTHGVSFAAHARMQACTHRIACACSSTTGLFVCRGRNGARRLLGTGKCAREEADMLRALRPPSRAARLASSTPWELQHPHLAFGVGPLSGLQHRNSPPMAPSSLSRFFPSSLLALFKQGPPGGGARAPSARHVGSGGLV